VAIEDNQSMLLDLEEKIATMIKSVDFLVQKT